MSKIPLKPDNEQYTDEQWQSVFDGGDNLLVSASAGSGKTTVLVRRVIEKLKNGSNIDELLIVTFTEAAAREMKERIQTALQAALNNESDSARRQHFTHQLILLPTANISTLHAFCLTVIRRFYYLIDLDPVFRMLTDETETILLKEDVWDSLREQYYEERQEDFYQLTANFSNDRGDSGLADLIYSLYEFARANPTPEKWLRQLVQKYQLTDGIEGSELYQQYMKPQLIDMLHTVLHQYQQAEMCVKHEEGLEKIQVLLTDETAKINYLLEAIEQDYLETAYQLISDFEFSRYPSIRKEELKEQAASAKQLRDACKKQLTLLQDNFFAVSPARMVELLQKSEPLVAEMAACTIDFMNSFQQRKFEKNVLDFNDLEHFTLQILQKTVDNEAVPSEASNYYRNKFTEVLVDEYQDVNRLQEAILYWLREPNDDAGNMFMVGDVKQSIYSFRLADPTLFIEKYEAFQTETGGRRIVLAENFRSRKEVLDFTNLIFQQLMDPAVGQIDYDEAAQLIAGFPDFPESTAFHTELLIYEKEQETVEQIEGIEDKTDGELYMTGLKIRQLIDSEFNIYDKRLKKNRPLQYKDIVLLTPTKKNNLAILDVFKTLNIPLEVNDAQNYFQATEIRIMISLLQLIDNPYQDIPLAAVLRSPIVQLQEEELAEIRLADEGASYYEALLAYMQQHQNSLSERLKNFHDTFLNWRELARRISIVQLLWKIYEETAYVDYVLGLPAGKQRYANLIALVERAKAYEAMSFRGLYQFIRFIEKMQEKDKDLAEPLAVSAEDAVRVMTIHASKGLEFPVVFLLDMTKEFNLQDTKARYIFEEKLGAGIRYLDENERVLYDTLPYQVIKQMKMKKLLSEEMRKLYVGLTRAEQKLYLVGSYKDKAATLAAWSEAASEAKLVVSNTIRLKAKSSFMNWVGYSLIRHPAMKLYFDEASSATSVDLPALQQHPAQFQISWFNQADFLTAKQQLAADAQPIQAGEQALGTFSAAEMKQRLSFDYPYQEAISTTSYQSVSEVKRLFDDPDNQGVALLSWEESQQRAVNQRFRYVDTQLSQPKFMTEKQQISAAAIGTATHTIMQLLPLTRKPTDKQLDHLIIELTSANSISQDVAERINRQRILDFFDTEFAQMLMTHAPQVRREQPFSMLLPANQLFRNYPDETDPLLIHGIVDGYIELAHEVILYDFKTDYVHAGNEAGVVAKHLGQLRLYKEALKEALGKPVTATYLILLETNSVVDVTNQL